MHYKTYKVQEKFALVRLYTEVVCNFGILLHYFFPIKIYYIKS